MRIVLDTNVIISALLFDGLPERLLLNALAGSDQLISSSYIIAEATRILESKFSVQPNSLELLQQLLGESEIVHFNPFLNIITDEQDNRVLETAVKGYSQYIVTGDKLLFELKEYVGIHMIKVREYLELTDKI